MTQAAEKYLDFLKKNVFVCVIADHIQEKLRGLPVDLWRHPSPWDHSGVFFKRKKTTIPGDVLKGIEIFMGLVGAVSSLSSYSLASKATDSKSTNAVLYIFDHLDFTAINFASEVDNKIYKHWNGDYRRHWAAGEDRERVGMLPTYIAFLWSLYVRG